ncbi:hypothetical protein ACC709_36905, partial [Rhizobium ruizarguesonis]
IALSPFTDAGTIAGAGLWAMLGSAEALSYAAASGDITAVDAKNELFETIVAMVARSMGGGFDTGIPAGSSRCEAGRIAQVI